jgi:hypothetical protein
VTRTSSTTSQPPLYREEQHFRQWWVWLLVIGAAAVSWWPFIAQVIGGTPVGQNPAPDWAVVVIWLFVGIGLPLLFGLVALVLEVIPDAVIIRYRPFTRRIIPIDQIERVEPREYNAVKEYGGWGVKGWSRQKVAYNVSGGRGAELTLSDGRRVMLGSQRADELALVIAGRLRARGRPRARGRD